MERAQPPSLGFEELYTDEVSSYMAFAERRYYVLSSLCCLQESDSVALAALTLNTDRFGRGKGQVESPGRPCPLH